jgi:hypothetical protein
MVEYPGMAVERNTDGLWDMLTLDMQRLKGGKLDSTIEPTKPSNLNVRVFLPQFMKMLETIDTDYELRKMYFEKISPNEWTQLVSLLSIFRHNWRGK